MYVCLFDKRDDGTPLPVRRALGSVRLKTGSPTRGMYVGDVI